MKVLCADTNQNLYDYAVSFVLPYEQECCALMQRILSHDKAIYLVCDYPAASPMAVHGVLLYNAGRTIFHCLPQKTNEVKAALKGFLAERAVFCVTGESTGTVFLERIILEAGISIEYEVRDYQFFEYKPRTLSDIGLFFKEYEVMQCAPRDIELVLPLQFEYAQVEVLPQGRTLNRAVERLSFEQTLHLLRVYAVKKQNVCVAKAQINASGKNYEQIGGVFTIPSFRNRGIASHLVHIIADQVVAKNKKAVLFAKVTNHTAIHSYKKAGFVPIGKYRIVYYNE